jgi:hypothetical protein
MTLGRLAHNFQKAAKWLLPSSAFIYVFSLFFPWVSGTPSTPDDSWEMVLHAAFDAHLQFGRDIVFTFGPWGFLYGGYFPPTFPICAAAWTIIAFVFWWAGWRVANHFSSNKFFAWLWFMGFAGVAGMRVEQSFDIRMIGWALLLLLLHFFVEDGSIGARQVLLVFVSGMLALAKFTGLIEIAAVVILITADDLFRRRRFPWIVVLFAGSVLFFWILAGQHLALLWPFLRYSFVLGGGYTEAMMWTPPGETLTAAGMVLATAVLVVWLGYAAWVQRRFFGFFPVAGLAAMLFFTFKHGYVRYDQIHEITAALQLLLAALACLAVAWPVLRKKTWWVGAGGFVVLAGIYIFCSATFSRCYREQHFPDERLWKDFAWTLNSKNVLAPARLLRDPEHLRNVYAKNLAEVRNTFPLPPIEGSVDVYPWNQAVLFAHGLQYDPRPVIQSYSAFTPELAELNAAHLRGSNAPDNVLFGIDPTDAHFPSLEDGRSWPEFLTRYDVKGMTNTTLLLKRSAAPRTFQLTLLTELPVHFDEPVTLPATRDAPIWAELEIKKSFFGAIASMLYKPPALTVKVSLSGGPKFYYYLIPGMAHGGFLLSPLIQDTKSFVALASTSGWSTNLNVVSIAVMVPAQFRATTFYKSPIRLHLYRLDFPKQDLNPAEVSR